MNGRFERGEFWRYVYGIPGYNYYHSYHNGERPPHFNPLYRDYGYGKGSIYYGPHH